MEVEAQLQSTHEQILIAKGSKGRLLHKIAVHIEQCETMVITKSCSNRTRERLQERDEKARDEGARFPSYTHPTHLLLFEMDRNFFPEQ